MSLLKRLREQFRVSNEESDEKIDYWCIRWMPADSDGGFRKLEEYNNLNFPMDQDEFEYLLANPKPGRYRLFAVRNHKLVEVSDEFSWCWIVDEASGGNSDVLDEGTRRELDELRESIRKLEEIF